MECRHSSINFEDSGSINVASRDYGLLKISQRSTPFPSVQKSLSATKIAQHLGALQENSPNSSNSESKISICPLKNKGTSTPHPSKGVELNPKVLVRNMLTNKAKRFLNVDEGSIKSYSTGILSNDLHQGFVSSNLKPSVKNETFRNKNTQSNNNEKKVTWVIPHKYLHFVSSHHEMLSFNERRRLFNLGEYTIAKNGKKMSEVVMAEQPLPDTSMEHMDGADWQANVALTSYMHNHGVTTSDSARSMHFFRNRIH